METTARARASAEPAFKDGFGKRHQLTGPKGEALEVLILGDRLSAQPGIETTLREQLDRLSGFHHPSCGRVRGIARVVKSEAGLGIVSEQVRGERLSNLLRAAETRQLPLDVGASFWMIGQLVAAVALLHERVPGFSHGAIAPERIVITPDARLVVVEPILGAVLEQLDWSPQEYWRQLRVAVPSSSNRPAFDQRTDVTQVGAVALALLLGHPLGDDYPARVGGLTQGSADLSAEVALELLPDGIREWLSRALQIAPDGSFNSAIEAQAALDEALDDADYIGAPEALKAFLEAYDDRVVVEHPAEVSAPPIEQPAAVEEPVAADEPAPAEDGREASPVPTPVAAPVIAPVAAPVAARPAPVVEDEQEEENDEEEDEEGVVLAPVRAFYARKRLVAAVVTVVLAASATTFAARRYFTSPSAASTGAIVINSTPPGVAVIVDGVRRGDTPLRLELGGGDHVLELSGVATSVATAAVPVEPKVADVVVPPAAPAPAAAAAPAAGWISVKAPGEVQIYEDRRLLGSSLSDRIMTTAGRHELEIVNQSLGYRATRNVSVGAGQVSTISLDWPTGSIAVNALPWAEVWVDGQRVGETPLGNVTVPIGPHQILFRHPDLGEQRQDVVVPLGPAVRISADLRRK